MPCNVKRTESVACISVLFLFVVVALLFVRHRKKSNFVTKQTFYTVTVRFFWYFYSSSAESLSNSGL